MRHLLRCISFIYLRLAPPLVLPSRVSSSLSFYLLHRETRVLRIHVLHVRAIIESPPLENGEVPSAFPPSALKLPHSRDHVTRSSRDLARLELIRLFENPRKSEALEARIVGLVKR